MKQFLLKSVLLLCALTLGGGKSVGSRQGKVD